MPGLPYIAAAYGVIWMLLFVYLLTIHQRLANVREELDAFRKRSEADADLPSSRTPASEHV